MPEKIQNNLYLLREQVTERHPRTKKTLIKDVNFIYLAKFFRSRGFKEQKVKSDINDSFDIKVFYKKSISDVKWKDFIKNIVEPNQDILNINKSTSESYIILFQNNVTKKIFASTGGYAHITVQEVSTNDFGIEILARIVKRDDKALKSTKERNLTGGIQGEVKFFRNDYNLYENDSFGKIYNELNALLTKENLIKSFGFKAKDITNDSLCIAKNSFSLKKSISFNELLNIIKKCEYLLTQDYTVEINSVNKVPKSENILIENLFDNLIQLAYQNYIDSTKFYSIEISNKEFDKYFQASTSKLSFYYKRKLKEFLFDDVARENQQILLIIIDLCGDSLTFEEFKKIIETATLETFDENNDSLTKDKLLYHFCSEIKYHDENYFLIEKEWFQIKKTFIDTINEESLYFLNENIYTGPKLEKWKDQSENAYNSSYIGKKNTYVFDTFTYLNIEACDILKIEDDIVYFYHIKKGFDNSMRDLCNQVYIASRKIIEDIKDNYSYMEGLYSLVINNNGKSPYYKKAKTQFGKLTCKMFLENIKDKKVIFVLAVLDTSVTKRSLIREIDKFESNIAKFTLIELSKNMRNLGVDFQILQLNK
ncbi:DUF6119 family protein [Chryseobacterium sediminis]|uniref:DUF6119 family protein n=1 Tax=Chryseobacterium sediminis TaxID=1679494 RepID=UPI00285A5A60|nr:DUF6119 family protein [Chryseobacterium sediminis]MDR6462867.1 uncharacterized protein (TIGR04141 family) [Chryseobacterium sediminis]